MLMSKEYPNKKSEPAQVPSQVLDRKHLFAGEKVIWEGRPSFMIVLMRPIVLTVLALILAFIILSNSGPGVTLLAAIIVGAVMIPLNRRFGIIAAIAGIIVAAIVVVGGGTFLPLVLIPIVVGIIPLIMTYMQWRHTTLAATDRRLIAQYGLLNLAYADTGIDNVQTIKVKQPWYERVLGFGDIMILTSGDMGETKERRMLPGFKLLQGGGMIWLDIERPLEVEKMLGDLVYRPRSTKEPAESARHHGRREDEQDERMKEKGQMTEDEYEQKRIEIIKRV